MVRKPARCDALGKPRERARIRPASRSRMLTGRHDLNGTLEPLAALIGHGLRADHPRLAFEVPLRALIGTSIARCTAAPNREKRCAESGPCSSNHRTEQREYLSSRTNLHPINHRPQSCAGQCAPRLGTETLRQQHRRRMSDEQRRKEPPPCPRCGARTKLGGVLLVTQSGKPTRVFSCGKCSTFVWQDDRAGQVSSPGRPPNKRFARGRPPIPSPA
jgi:hypothetical protein